MTREQLAKEIFLILIKSNSSLPIEQQAEMAVKGAMSIECELQKACDFERVFG